MFCFACKVNSPKEGAEDGKPKPRKSKAAKLAIVPVTIKGSIVRVATIAFGRTCRIIIDASEIPRDFAAFICGKGNYVYISQILRYRVAKNESLMENLYKFLYLIKKKPIQFTYSPQYGLSLWPHDVGFQHIPAMEKYLHAAPHHFFADYITETTTFHFNGVM